MEQDATLYFSAGLLEPDAAVSRFLAVRGQTEKLVSPLSEADMTVQSMPDVSPTKWHLAHTTWFFETFILKRFDSAWREFDPAYCYLFNSYYEAVGARHPRPERGMLTRPPLGDILDYRKTVTDAVARLLRKGPKRKGWEQLVRLLDLGCHHEEQHQELLLTDIKHVLAQNPLKPAYHKRPARSNRKAPKLGWKAFEEDLYEIGHGGKGFAFDCEGPRHKAYLYPFALASRPVTNGEYRAFIEDGGYRRPELWLSDGWEWVCREERCRPLYWEEEDGELGEFTLHGAEPLNPEQPVCHLSCYEADAYARWKGCRLPTEAELEVAEESHANGHVNDAGTGRFHPEPARPGEALCQLMGDVWEWTSSAFAPYPGFRPAPGAVGEYNGKFMANQMVIKGGSCATPAGHIRPSYRNFFYLPSQWQFTGVRLAKDA